VKAIIVAGDGLAHCDAGVTNARGLTALAGRPEIPVACGHEEPLEGEHVYPNFMRNGADDLGKLGLPDNPEKSTDTDGSTLLADTIDANKDIILLTLGPLTNVADVFQSQPELIDNIKMIYIMGGAVGVDGNTNIPGVKDGNSAAEFNIFIDPAAANIVFASDAPITLIPLDATNAVPLNNDFMTTLQNDQAASPAIFTYRMLDHNRLFVASGGYYFWDPLAAGILTDESLATIEETVISVITVDGDENGRTIESDDGYPMGVATSADGDAFQTLFLDILNGRTSK
jgi:inosine-uridine nucleoside N-ribohydrolase